MDTIAAEADVAKATLYSHFANKEALFCAVVESATSRLLDGAKAQLDKPRDFERRLLAVIEAKFHELFKLVSGSPHVNELLAQSHLVGDIVERKDKEYSRMLAEMIGRANASGEIDLERVGLSSHEAARHVIRCAVGATHHCTKANAHRKNLAEICRVFARAVSD